METQSYITSGDDLRRIIAKCSKCNDATRNGELIIPFDELRHISLLHHEKNKNICIIANTQSKNTIPGTVGHWFSISIYKNRSAVVCDGLDKIKYESNIWRLITEFCEINGLKLINAV